MSLKIWLAIIGLTSASAGVVYYLHDKSSPDELPSVSNKTQNDEKKASAILPAEVRESGKFNPFDYHFIPGKAYQITFKREITGEAQKEPGKMNSFGESKVAGSMVVNSVKYENNKLFVVVQYFLKTVQSPLFNFAIAHEFGVLKIQDGNTATVPTEADKFKNTLLFELSPTGRILRTMKSAAHGMSNEGVFIASDALSSALFNFPKEPAPSGGGKVVRKLTDDKGTSYEMEFNYSSLNSSEVTIIGYTEIVPPKQKPGAPDIGFFARTVRDLKVSWDKNAGMPTALNVSLDQEVKIQNQKIASGHTSMESTWSDAGPSKFSKEELALFDTSVDISDMRRKREEKAAEKSDKISTWYKAQHALNKVSKMSETEQSAVFNDVSSLLKSHPELMGQFFNEAKNAAPDSVEQSMLIGAMGTVGNAEAQKSMVELFNDPKAGKETKEKILTELALSPQALTPETKSLLSDVYHNSDSNVLSAEAGYALGASLNHQQDKKLVNEFQKSYQEAKSGESKIYLLQVMGNDRGTDFRSEISSAANSSDAALRAASADALRFATDDSGRSILFRQTSDSNPGVRISAFGALQYQPYDTKTFGALSSCVNSDSDPSVRAACYDVLCSHLNDPNTVSLLKNRANNESSESLRMKIQEAVK